MSKLYFVAWVVNINDFFQLPSADIRSAFTAPVLFRSDTLSTIRYGYLWKEDQEKIIVFYSLIRKHVKYYLVCMHGWCVWTMEKSVY